MQDTIIVRLKGVLTPAERQLGKDPDGAKLINELKGKLIEKAKPLLEPLLNLAYPKNNLMHRLAQMKSHKISTDVVTKYLCSSVSSNLCPSVNSPLVLQFSIIEDLTGAKVVDMHFSFDVQTGERIEIFTLNKDLEKSCQI